jgi:Zn-dependent M28 family amino/carboxypeptidase
MIISQCRGIEANVVRPLRSPLECSAARDRRPHCEHPRLGVLAAMAFLSVFHLAAAASRAGVREVAAQLRDQALRDSRAWDILESLVSEIGARPTGSPAMTRARDWAVKKLADLGFQNVHAEPFTKKNAWLRGAESASMSSPYARALSVVGLGNGVPTPSAGIEGEIVLFSTLEELIRMPAGSLRGKIAVINQPMVRTQNEEGYRSAVRVRVEGPSLAAARGAVAFLTRSISTSDSQLPHTGLTRYTDGVPRIPAAAIGVPDAQLLARLAARRTAVRVRLLLASTVLAQVPAWNVVGEVIGREAPDQVILIGGHLDSWDLSEAASDDGAGVAITTAAAALVATLPRHPRRTIRVVLWGSEETEGSGAAYADTHRAELHSLVMAAESDFGAGRAYRLALPEAAATDERVNDIGAALAPLKVFVSTEAARSGGSDVEALRKAGVPVASFNQDQSHYFDVHHSADDTLERIDAAALNQNVAAWSALIYILAETELDFRAVGR